MFHDHTAHFLLLTFYSLHVGRKNKQRYECAKFIPDDFFSELKQIMLDLYSSRQQNDKYYLLSITKYMKLRFLPFQRHPFQNGEIRNLRQVSWEFYLAKGIFMILIQEKSVWRANLQKNFVSFNFELHTTLNQGLSCM